MAGSVQSSALAAIVGLLVIFMGLNACLTLRDTIQNMISSEIEAKETLLIVLWAEVSIQKHQYPKISKSFAGHLAGDTQVPCG